VTVEQGVGCEALVSWMSSMYQPTEVVAGSVPMLKRMSAAWPAYAARFAV
jgi:hypothetical protein